MRSILVLPLAAFVTISGAAAPTSAAEGNLWIRHAAISPDGDEIAFTYRGRIFTVDAAGGEARALTPDGSYSHNPVWSPDSSEIAFASDINGDDDLFVTDAQSGTVRRLTWTSRAEVPTSFAPDGTSVLYNSTGLGDAKASRQAALNGSEQLYAARVDVGGRRLVLPLQAEMARWNRDATRLAYTYNPSVDPNSRQHRVASNARQIWIYDAGTGRHERVLEGSHDVLDPVWSADGRTLFYLGEASGTLNVWKLDLSSGATEQLTFHEDRPARFLSVSDAGDIAYHADGAIRMLPHDGSEARTIGIDFSEQRMAQPVRRKTFDATEFVSSPDGAYFAAVIAGEVVLLDRQGNSRRITDTVAAEMSVAFSPDGSKLVYAAQRDHVWGVYAVDLLRDQVGDALALSYTETELVQGQENAFQPAFSPDGTKLAYVHARREIRVLDVENGETHTPYAPEDYNTSYLDGDLWFSWSPDSRHLLASWKSVPFSTAVKAGIMRADGTGDIRPISEAVPEFAGAMFSPDGTQILALTPLYGLRTLDQSGEFMDFYRIFMSDEARADFIQAVEGGPLPEGTYDFAESRPSYLEGKLTRESARYVNAYTVEGAPFFVAVASDMGGRQSIISIDLRDGMIRELVHLKDTTFTHASYAAATGMIDLKTEDGVVSIPLDDPESRSFQPISVELSLDLDLRRRAAFEQVWADIRFKFYRSDVEGRDWDAIGDHYRGYLDSIATDRELARLVDEMFGEISASHLFVNYEAPESEGALGTETAALGIYRDFAYDGEGVRIAGILHGGPLDRPQLPIGPGDVVLSINGEPLPDVGGLDRALDGKDGQPVLVGFRPAGGDRVQTLRATPVSIGWQGYIAHRNWVDTRRSRVAERSRGCIVYAHLSAMDNDNYLDAYGRLIAARNTARGALIDIRSNTGGNLHRQLVSLLSGKAYAQVGLEGRNWDLEPLDRWIMPSALVVDSLAYSDGSIFPQVYRDAGVGKVVGDSLLNTGTGVDYIRSSLIDGLVYGIPVQPFRFLDGRYYENQEFEPDLLVPFDPNAMKAGEDPKLDAAIDLLTAEIGEGIDCRR